MSDFANLSPPRLSLGESIDRIKKVYGTQGTTPMAREVLAEELGYSGISGASVSAIAALRKYGLIEGRTDSTRISRDGQILAIDDPNSEDYKKALQRSALHPRLFSALDTKGYHGGSKERAIAVFLEKEGMRSRPARTAAKNFVETMSLISRDRSFVETSTEMQTDEDEDVSGSASTMLPGVMSEMRGSVDKKALQRFEDAKMQLAAALAGSTNSIESAEERRKDIFSLEEGEVIIEMPERISKESFEDFQDWLELIKRKVKRSMIDDDIPF